MTVGALDDAKTTAKRGRALRLLLGTAWRAAPGAVLLGMVLHPLGFVLRALDAVWVKLLTDAAVAADTAAALWAAAGATVAIGVGSVALGAGARNRSTIEERVTFEIERTLADATASLPGLEQHESPEYVGRIETIRQGQRQLGSLVKDAAYTASSIIGLVVSVVLLASVHPWLALVPLAGLPMFWAARRANARKRPLEESIGREYLLARHLLTLTRNPASAKEIRVFNLAPVLSARLSGCWHSVKHAYVNVALRDSAESLIATAAANAAYAGAVILTVRAAANGTATPGDVVMVALIGQQAMGSLGRLIGGIFGVAAQLRVAERLLWVLDQAAAIDIHDHATPAVPVPPAGAIVALDGVTFRYPGTDRDVLTDVTIELQPGAVIALVGQNGAGKSTLVKLLCGFYQPTEGQVTVDGRALTAHDAAAWRSQLTAGFQDFARLEVPLGESVAVGDLQQPHSKERAAWALTQASADGIIARAPNGMETMLGRQWPAGIDLSGGEWQKVSNGRALMREHPRLIIFDEPTSALDPASEQAMFDQLGAAARLTRQSITLFVSHRFSTVRHADRIIVFEDGRIVEDGTHEDLVGHDGLYARLFETQAAGYRDTASTPQP